MPNGRRPRTTGPPPVAGSFPARPDGVARGVATTPPPRDVPGVARDPTSLTAILEELGRDGFRAELAPVGRDRPGAIRCGACGEASDASLFTVADFRRMEGASDPDEMVAVAALRCPICDTGGALVLTYGPEVTADDAAVLERLPDPPEPRVHTDDAPGTAAGAP